MMRLSVRRPGATVLMAALAFVLRGSLASAQDSSTTVRIGLRYAAGTKPGVLVLPVSGDHGDSVRAIIQRDLDYGDRTNVVAQQSFVVDTVTNSGQGQFNYPLYARLGAVAVVQPTISPAGLQIAVHDVSTQKVERVKEFRLGATPQSPDWRMQLHAISDTIEFWITGTHGVAATRILYSSGNRIWQIDSDGANPTPLTPVSEGIRFPAWHPKATHITYTVQTDEGTRIVVRELGAEGTMKTVPAPSGSLNSASVFSPDGLSILYAHGLENGTDLYVRPLNGNESPRRVTVSRGSRIAISPSYSPDGRRIVYATDRPGTLGLYISDADGTNSEPLTPFNFGDKSQRTDPSWSPDGRLIAFQAEREGGSQIHTVNVRDKGIRQYTNEGRNEDPSWSPDSRHLVFTSNRSGSWQLWVLDIESNRPRQLTRAAAGARAGAWSPRLIVH